MITTVEELLQAYHDAQRVVIAEYHGNPSTGAKALDDEVEAIAAELGITWVGCDCAGMYYDFGEEE